MNKVIQSLWIGDSLSTMEQLCINSFLQNGHDFHLYVYSCISNIPRGTILLDANQIIPNRLIFKDSFGTFASFADWFRFKLLYLKGGWWTDMDSICLKYFNIPTEYCFATEYLSENDQTNVYNICNLKAPPRAEILQDCLNVIIKLRKTLKIIPWGAFGIRLFKEIIKNYDVPSSYKKPPTAFCPIGWYEIKELIGSNMLETIIHSSFSIHLFNDMWRRNKMDKNLIYPPTSLYEKLKKMYSPDI